MVGAVPSRASVSKPVRSMTAPTGGSFTGAGGSGRSRGQPLRDPVVDMVDAVERPALQLDRSAEGAAVELHVGEVLEQDVIRLGRRALELLAGQRCRTAAA